ncbi:MAG TPA: hypothetical protein VNA13_00450, partial [Xanthomonadales bacterium]|nr:hypothetical protein [Xanthomonadales bacterium]
EVSAFDEGGEVLYRGTEVTGTGIKECEGIVFCLGVEQLPALQRFNERNASYILAFSSEVTSGAAGFRAQGLGLRDGNLKYKHCSNASVFLELPGYQHQTQSPIAHLRGLMDMTNKLFAVEERIGDTWEERYERDRMLDEITEVEEDLAVIRGNFKVVASEKENRMEIYRQPESEDDTRIS